jgi:GNAT superfamily N-acetyltransferase
VNSDKELARRSILGFGEIAIALGSGGAGVPVRGANVVGSRIDRAADNPWFSAAVVPPGLPTPDDEPQLPHCLWTIEDAAAGRVEVPEIATPCMGIALDDPNLPPVSQLPVEVPSLAIIGELNERAYADVGTFGPLIEAAIDSRIRTHGLRVGDSFVCVALTLDVGDDLGIHYVATDADHRRQGLASQLVRIIMADAQTRGMRTATLQASDDGLPVWERLGFRRVATLRGFVRAG